MFFLNDNLIIIISDSEVVLPVDHFLEPRAQFSRIFLFVENVGHCLKIRFCFDVRDSEFGRAWFGVD